jgi:hypothetical protein
MMAPQLAPTIVRFLTVADLLVNLFYAFYALFLELSPEAA